MKSASRSARQLRCRNHPSRRRLLLESLENRSLMAVVSHWTGDNTALDSVGPNHGTLVGGAAYSAGQMGQAFHFDGINESVELGDPESLRLTASLTIEGWVRVDAYPTTGASHGHIVFRGDDRGGLDPYYLAVTPSGSLRFNIDGLAAKSQLHGGTLPLGQFVHVAATLDDATGAQRIYVNGALVAETITSARPFADLDPAFNPGVAIGHHAGSPNSPHKYALNGRIDELKVHNEALTAADVLDIFTAGNGGTLPSVSIGDASAIEGATATKFLDAFIYPNSGGLANARNIAYGPDGNLYVASGGSDAVLRYDSGTGSLIDVFVPSGSGGLDNPWAMTFGPDGNLYVSGVTTRNVLRFDGTTGAFIDEFVPVGASGLNEAKGLLFGADGNLYVSNSGGAGGAPGPHTVLRFQGPTSAEPGAPLPAPGQADAIFVADGSGGLNNPNGLAFGPDGSLYVANTFVDSINRYSASTGAFLGTFVAVNSGGLDTPSQMVFRSDGSLYVTSQSSHQVLRYNATTGAFVDAVVAAGSGGLDSPNGILFDATGNLYIASGQSSTVLRYGSAAQAAFTVSLNSPSALPVSVDYAAQSGSAAVGSDFTAASGTITFAPGQTSQTILVQTLDDPTYEGNETFTINLSNPAGGVITDGQGVGTIVDNEQPPTKFYVVDDASANKTFEYGPTGSAVESYNLNSGNTAPRGAASNVAGDKVWVVDANKKVFVYDASGGLLGSWTAGTLPNNADVQGVATNGVDVWIVDAQGDKVYRYTGAASRLSGSQNAAASPISLNNSNKDASDIVTDGVSLWVLNNANSCDKVFKYTVSGTLLGSWTISGAGSSPTGITLDPASPSHLWIVDSGTDRVYQFDAAVGRTSGSQSPSTSFALAAGNTNPQGIADPPVGADDGAYDTALLSLLGDLDSTPLKKKRL